ncbi:MAG: hypothetical protein PHT33_09185 [bacterium]|nr:hypothetical protein [bacterium]
MRKRIFAFALAICLLCGTIPMSAYAASSTGSTTVYYTVDSSYEVVIPSTINLNEEDGFQFSATSCVLPSGKVLYVAVDSAKTYTDGGVNFHLFNDKGTEDESRISCLLRVSSSEEDSSYTDVSGTVGASQIVAVFGDGNLNPILRGYMRFALSASNAPAGTYTGQIYFNIYLDDASHYTENS